MADNIANTIDVLSARAQAKEEDANKLKRLVNELCLEAGLAPRFQVAAAGSTSYLKPRSDAYYGLTIVEAVKAYLEARKSSQLGAANLDAIFDGIKAGGFVSETRTEDIARISLANALRRYPTIFHRLKNSNEYGLTAWYPKVKVYEDEDKEGAEKAKGEQQSDLEGDGEESDTASSANSSGTTASDDSVTSNDVRAVIIAQTGKFTKESIEKAVKTAHPNKRLHALKISGVLFHEKGKLIKVVSEKQGKTKAVYEKI